MNRLFAVATHSCKCRQISIVYDQSKCYVRRWLTFSNWTLDVSNCILAFVYSCNHEIEIPFSKEFSSFDPPFGHLTNIDPSAWLCGSFNSMFSTVFGSRLLDIALKSSESLSVASLLHSVSPLPLVTLTQINQKPIVFDVPFVDTEIIWDHDKRTLTRRSDKNLFS